MAPQDHLAIEYFYDTKRSEQIALIEAQVASFIKAVGEPVDASVEQEDAWRHGRLVYKSDDAAALFNQITPLLLNWAATEGCCVDVTCAGKRHCYVVSHGRLIGRV